MAPRTARLVVIGDEILTGKVEDSNGPWLLKRLRRWGLACTGVVVVPDSVPRIARAVAEAAAEADVVFTSGGVGPTHDDVTVDGVAAAFGLPVVEHPVLRELIERHWASTPSPASLRMARVPEGTKVELVGRLPLVSLRNVYVVPGIPELFRGRIDALAERLQGQRVACAAVRTGQGEGAIADLMAAVEQAHAVRIGSYPRWEDPEVRVLITVEGEQEAEVRAATDALVAGLDPALLRGVDPCHHPEDEPS